LNSLVSRAACYLEEEASRYFSKGNACLLNTIRKLQKIKHL